MKTLFRNFFNQFNNQSVEVVDPTNRNQCFDLAVAWCMWLGLPINIFSGLMYAYQIFSNPNDEMTKKFDFILNKGYSLPKAGDIVVFAKSFNGTAGHVVVATGEGDVNSFKAFSQNDPVGSPCVVRTYSYNHVAGWLRFIQEEVEVGNELQECLRLHREAITELDQLKPQLEETKRKIEALELQLQDKDRVVSEQSEQLLTVRKERDSALEESKDYKEKYEKADELRDKWYGLYNQANSNYESCKTDRSNFQRQLTEIENKLKPKTPWILSIYNLIISFDQTLRKNG
jgi:hypothetical protein